MKFVAVTACPTGIAHTYLAAESLKKTALEQGIDVKVETRGAIGIESELTQSDINEADAVILAVAVAINTSQFAGKPIVEVPITEAIRNPKEVFQKANEIALSFHEDRDTRLIESIGKEGEIEKTTKFQLPKPFMSGISHIISFLTVFGIFVTLSHMWPIPLFQKLSDLSITIVIPILAGSIAYSIADRPGITSGVISGMIAMTNPSSGVLGGIVGGLLSGWITNLLKKIKLPNELNGLLPVFFIPAISTLVIGFLMMNVLGDPLSFLLSEIVKAIDHLHKVASIILGALIGAMLAYDLGGPINKIAYSFGLLMMIEGVFEPQAASLASGMVPPLSVAIATTIYPKIFSEIERKAGKRAWLLGLAFVVEGAQPFLSKNSSRIKIAFIFGSAVSGALSMGFHITAVVPHGGIFAVFFANHPLWFLFSTVTGVIVSTLMILIAKYKIG